MELLICISRCIIEIDNIIFKFQYGATNMAWLQMALLAIILFKFQYGATNILIVWYSILRIRVFKFQYGATNIIISGLLLANCYTI